MEKEVVDTLTMRRVANGWVISPGMGFCTEFTHVATTPADLAKHVEAWASAQIASVQHLTQKQRP